MPFFAVLTGDIVKSRKLPKGEIENVIELVKKTFADAQKKILGTKIYFQIYRGDSFQAVISKPELALIIALMLRTRLRSFVPRTKSRKNIMSKKTVSYAYSDARIAIGIGKIENLKKRNILESQGEAFVLSGHLFENIDKKNDRLAIKTIWNDINKELQVETKLADAIISRWTPKTAEAVYLYFTVNKNQSMIARKLQISQPALHKRLVKNGHIKSIELFTERFSELISNPKL